MEDAFNRVGGMIFGIAFFFIFIVGFYSSIINIIITMLYFYLNTKSKKSWILFNLPYFIIIFMVHIVNVNILCAFHYDILLIILSALFTLTSVIVILATYGTLDCFEIDFKKLGCVTIIGASIISSIYYIGVIIIIFKYMPSSWFNYILDYCGKQ